MTYSLVTIGLITYNAKNSLEKVVACIKAQVWSNWECVVVDDVSKDGTYEMLMDLSNEDSRFRVFSNGVNSGAGTSRHRIVNEAKGEFICFFDDDDVSDPYRVHDQYQRIVSYEREFCPNFPVICHVSRRVSDGAGKVWYVKGFGCVDGIAPHGNDVAEYILYGKKIPNGQGSIGTGVQMARTKSYKAAGNFDPVFRRCQDTELAVRWAMIGAHFVGVEKILMNQTISLTKGKIDLEKKFALLQLEKHKTFLEQRHIYDFIYPWTQAKYAFWEGDKVKFLKLLVHCFIKHPILSAKRILSALAGLWYTLMLRHKYKNSPKI